MPEPASPSPRRGLLAGAAAPIAYLLLGMAFTWPTIIRLHDYVISEYMDAATAFYNLWWFHQAVCVLHSSPWTNPFLDYPYGYSMVLFPIWVPYDALALPFLHFLGEDGLPVTLNLISILSFAASGFSMFLLVRYLTRDPRAAFIAGLALAASPFRFWNLTRWHVAGLELMVLPLYFFLRAAREKSRRATIAFAVFAALLAYTSPNYTLDLALALPFMILFAAAWAPREVISSASAKKLLMAVCLAFIFCSPLIVRLALELAAPSLPLSQPDSLRVPYSANLIGFVTPGANLRAYASLAPHLPYPDLDLKRQHGIAGYELFLGHVVIILAALGAASKKREARLFLVLALVFITLSLGPLWQIGNSTSTSAAPYSWLSHLLPWLKMDRAPVRHSALALISIVALAGIGLAALLTRLSRRKQRFLLAAVFLVVILEFNQAPLRLDHFPVPAFVLQIKTDPQFGSVLDLPFLPDIQRLGGFHQMIHHKPLAYQLTSRIDDPRYLSSPLFVFLDHPRLWLTLPPDRRQAALGELKAEFKKRRLRYLVAYPKFMEPEDRQGLELAIRELAPEKVIEADDAYWVFRFRLHGE